MFPAIVYIPILNITSIDLEHLMFIRIFVLDSICELITNDILFQKLNFPAARMKVLELPWNQKVSPGIYIYYTL